MPIIDDISALRTAYAEAVKTVQTSDDLEKVRITFLSRNGMLAAITKQFQDLDGTQKRSVGPILQELKQFLQQTFAEKESEIASFLAHQQQLRDTLFDVTMYRTPALRGSLHIYSQVINRLQDIFMSMGYLIVDGPEVESEYNNFTALNIPLHHPAREMQDTFWLGQDDLLLRTQTSPVQIRTLTERGVPLAMFSTGRVYRNEETDASHDYLFTQGEAMFVDIDVSMANLVATVKAFLQAFFENDALEIRIRPGYFPFVEPGIEIDASCPFCTHGCSTCKHTGWIELMGGGLVHPHVLSNCGVNPGDHSGFAFGFGVERLAMIKYGISDIRVFHSSNISFLTQF